MISMKLYIVTLSYLLVGVFISGCQESRFESSTQPFCIVIHGGAGTILKENMTPELEEEYIGKIKESLQAGYDILKKQGTSLDAVQEAITILEDSPLFNAGKGAVFTNIGTNELDASIMDGKSLDAGAVAALKTIKNPIILARLVMEKSPHVMMIGEGAESFAKENDLETVSPDYFYTERRWQQLQKRIIEKEIKDKSNDNITFQKNGTDYADQKFGTVGCVALDKDGNLAAGTSTGGMTNKRFGRVGDSPIIGAGTYANNQTCAVSATGDGEYFIRSLVTHDISSLMAYEDISLQEAVEQVIMEKLSALGGKGGVIAIDKNGNISMVFNTVGMYRGYIDKDGNMLIKIYKD